MADVLTTNIDQVINRLNLYQRTVLPRAARRTVNQLGFDLARKDVPQYMQAVFDRPNKFTLRSLTYKVVSNYEVKLNFKQNVPKGNDPARYLYPVTKGLPGDEAYQTKFTRYIHSAGIAPKNRYPIPVKENLSKNSYGKVSQVSTPRFGQACRQPKAQARPVEASAISPSRTTATGRRSALGKAACLICRMASIG